MTKLVEFKNNYLKMMIDKGLDVQECEQDILKIIEEDGQKVK